MGQPGCTRDATVAISRSVQLVSELTAASSSKDGARRPGDQRHGALGIVCSPPAPGCLYREPFVSLLCLLPRCLCQCLGQNKLFWNEPYCGFSGSRTGKGRRHCERSGGGDWEGWVLGWPPQGRVHPLPERMRSCLARSPARSPTKRDAQGVLWAPCLLTPAASRTRPLPKWTKKNGAWVAPQHLKPTRWRTGSALAVPGTPSTPTLLTVTSLPPRPGGPNPLPPRSAPPP